jgi:hypothetical protein
MRKSSTWSLGRMVLTVAAMLVIAVPSLVYAVNPIPGYPKPQYGVIEGPATINAGVASGKYSLYVVFVDGSNSTFYAPEVTFTASAGTFNTNTGQLTDSSPGRVLITAQAIFSGVLISTSRVITVQ